MASSTNILILALTLALTTSMMPLISAQIVPSCLTNLLPCANYLISAKPLESCCNPLRDILATQRDCLCGLYKNPDLFQSLGMNMTQALGLPTYCGLSVDLTICNKVSAPAPSTTIVPSAPPVPGRNENGAGKMAWSGASTLLFFWVSILAYWSVFT